MRTSNRQFAAIRRLKEARQNARVAVEHAENAARIATVFGLSEDHDSQREPIASEGPR